MWHSSAGHVAVSMRHHSSTGHVAVSMLPTQEASLCICRLSWRRQCIHRFSWWRLCSFISSGGGCEAAPSPDGGIAVALSRDSLAPRSWHAKVRVVLDIATVRLSADAALHCCSLTREKCSVVYIWHFKTTNNPQCTISEEINFVTSFFDYFIRTII